VDRGSGKEFAIKILKTYRTVSHISTMWKEVDSLSSMNCEHIVRYHHSFPIHSKSSIAIVMEYLGGGNLGQFVKS